jgi:hypothetical protein
MSRRRRMSAVGYVLRDDFTDTRSPGSVHLTPCTPGPGIRYVPVDTQNIVRVQGGVLDTTTGVGTAYRDPTRTFTAVTRTPGRMLVVRFKTPSATGSTTGCSIGWFTSQSPAGWNYNDGEIHWYNNHIFYFQNAGRFSSSYLPATLDSYYSHVIVLRSVGCFYFRKTNEVWYLYWVEKSGTTATLYPGIVTITSGRKEDTIDFVRVPTILWCPTPLSADGFSGTWPITDGGGLTGIEAGGASRTWQTATPPTWTNSGGYAVNNPNLGSEMLSDPSLEATYVNGLCSSLTGSNATFWQENTDVHSGSKAQGIIPTAQWGGVRYDTSLIGNTWYRCSVYGKLVSGTDSVYAYSNLSGTSRYLYNASGYYLFSSGPYTLYSAVALYVSGSSYMASETSTSSPTGSWLVDDFSVKPLNINELIQVIDHGISDFFAEVKLFISFGFQGGIVFNYVNSSNFELVFYDRNANTNKIYWYKVVNGTYTLVTSVSATYADWARLCVRKQGTQVSIWYNEANVLVNTTTSGLNGTKQGLFSTASTVQLDDWRLWSIGSNGEYNLLDAFSQPA